MQGAVGRDGAARTSGRLKSQQRREFLSKGEVLIGPNSRGCLLNRPPVADAHGSSMAPENVRILLTQPWCPVLTHPVAKPIPCFDVASTVLSVLYIKTAALGFG